MMRQDIVQFEPNHVFYGYGFNFTTNCVVSFIFSPDGIDLPYKPDDFFLLNAEETNLKIVRDLAVASRTRTSIIMKTVIIGHKGTRITDFISIEGEDQLIQIIKDHGLQGYPMEELEVYVLPEPIRPIVEISFGVK